MTMIDPEIQFPDGRRFRRSALEQDPALLGELLEKTHKTGKPAHCFCCDKPPEMGTRQLADDRYALVCYPDTKASHAIDCPAHNGGTSLLAGDAWISAVYLDPTGTKILNFGGQLGALSSFTSFAAGPITGSIAQSGTTGGEGANRGTMSLGGLLQYLLVESELNTSDPHWIEQRGIAWCIGAILGASRRTLWGQGHLQLGDAILPARAAALKSPQQILAQTPHLPGNGRIFVGFLTRFDRTLGALRLYDDGPDFFMPAETAERIWRSYGTDIGALVGSTLLRHCLTLVLAVEVNGHWWVIHAACQHMTLHLFPADSNYEDKAYEKAIQEGRSFSKDLTPWRDLRLMPDIHFHDTEAAWVGEVLGDMGHPGYRNHYYRKLERFHAAGIECWSWDVRQPIPSFPPQSTTWTETVAKLKRRKRC